MHFLGSSSSVLILPPPATSVARAEAMRALVSRSVRAQSLVEAVPADPVPRQGGVGEL